MKITETAYAKINLGLEVFRKREDGYHEVQMVMQTLSLADCVEIQDSEGLVVTTDSSDLAGGQDNLAWKAAMLLAKRFQKKPNVHIKLNKRIFLAAGLAGGSADAAAVLRGLNKLWKLNLSVLELESLAAELGSDVPFCIAGGTSLAEGRGEVLTMLPDCPLLHIVLAKPKLEVATAWVYKNFQQNMVRQRPNIQGIMDALQESDCNKLLQMMGNVLESVTIPTYPIIKDIKKRMLKEGAQYALMSGSGPTVFGIAENAEKCKSIAAALQDMNLEIAITNTVKRRG